MDREAWQVAVHVVTCMLAVQQVRLSALTAWARVQSLVRELKSHKSCSAAEYNNSKN